MGNAQVDARTRFGGGYYIGGFRPLNQQQAQEYCTLANEFDRGYRDALLIGVGAIGPSIVTPALISGAAIETSKCTNLAQQGYRISPADNLRGIYVTGNSVLTYQDGEIIGYRLGDINNDIRRIG